MTSDDDPAARERRWPAALRRAVGIAEQIVGSLLVAVILIMVVLQAAQRYLPVDGWVWTGEFARYALVWLTFAVVGHLTSTGEHVGLQVVDYIARGLVLAVVRRFADLVVAVAAVAFVLDAWDLVTVSTSQTSPAAGLPIQLLYLLPLIGFALTAVRAGWAAIAGRADADSPPAPAPGVPATLPTAGRSHG